MNKLNKYKNLTEELMYVADFIIDNPEGVYNARINDKYALCFIPGEDNDYIVELNILDEEGCYEPIGENSYFDLNEFFIFGMFDAVWNTVVHYL